MTQFLVNQSGLDEVTLELNQVGSNETSINLKESLLDDKRDYVFCVDSLVVPLNNAPIFNLVGQNLFIISRRNVGTSADIPSAIVVYGAYTVTRNFHDVSAFISDLNNFCRGFEQNQTLAGIYDDIGTHYGAPTTLDVSAPFDEESIAPLRRLTRRTEAVLLERGAYKFIKFVMGSDGTLELYGTSDFWNNFVIDFTRVGAETLGLNHLVETVVHPYPAPNSYYLGFTKIPATGQITNKLTLGEAVATAALLVPGPGSMWALGNMDRDATAYSEHSLYQCADQRLKITVESHLPTVSNVQIINEKETVDRHICEVYFEKDTRSTTTFNAEGIYESSSIETNIYAGDYPLVKKYEQFKQWTKLKTAYELRFFRFKLKMWYRKYNSEKDVWYIEASDLDIPEDRRWSMLLRFVSEV